MLIDCSTLFLVCHLPIAYFCFFFISCVGAYTLDFDGRVTMASSKNFLMVSSHDIKGNVGVRFGRVEDSQFVMDVSWPCSPLQAMGVALASVLTKTTG